MGILIIRLLTIINTQPLDSTLYHIASIFLQHYDLIELYSIGEMADLAKVSKSTLSKFARQIGFDDYLHLKDNAGFITDRYNNHYNYLTNIVQELDQHNYMDYFQTIKQSIDLLQDTIDIIAIDRLADDLIAYNKVGVFGLIFSESASIDFQYKLAYNRKFVFTFQDLDKQEAFIRQANEDTLIIVFSNSGNFVRHQQVTEGKPTKNFFSKMKAKLFVITSDPTVLDLPHVDDAIIYPTSKGIQTHFILYQIIMDLIISRYRIKLMKTK
ncbi:MurR/RpiR family transcriptional regulator [Fundicoccus culcitae]|uniref:MurR/RpiR family transcriptional regulator n=1 Tax=Fundicoccus culcitae TaxID=2969821 RepID=A0ABY5P544_9LACT|nr:MurR/RpiR family transcriptional regulator [Fundicoccus culcitae]UUX33863.1 MurR/RpiR family transcriptional regulator [Fundicoccus culcitae]